MTDSARAERRRIRATLIRRLGDFDAAEAALAESPAVDGAEDDELRLIFTCCHPDLPLDARIALVLHEVCDVPMDDIGAARAKVRELAIPYQVPGEGEWHVRFACVLQTVHSIYTLRAGLSGEAIGVGRLLCDLVIDGEAWGLLALMLLLAGSHDEGRAVLAEALAAPSVGPWTIQAAIADLWAQTPTDWDQVVGLYDILMNMAPSPAIAADRASAIAQRTT